ncbi:MAG: mannonate dehydratase [Chitinophagaceae bacterium]|nr:mannonate dehydratase [Chitinophagaceae bacterium]
MLDKDHYQFARQCGATHVVVHLVDYFNNRQNTDTEGQPVGNESMGWGNAGDGSLWSLERLLQIKKEINAAGLEWEAIENFDPSMWYDVLLDGPDKKRQIELLKEQVRIIGRAGIPVVGYNFSLAGVAGRITGPFARGGAMSVGMAGVDNAPVPNGMVWNMYYDRTPAQEGFLPLIEHEELWKRVQYFLDELIPVAEEAGVKLAAHPDDPPMPYIRQTPRLVYQPRLYQKLLDMKVSKSNTLEFCLGSIAEMQEGDVYAATEQYAPHIAYVHFRNVKGKVPDYREVFLDEGDIDMMKILRILKANHFNGVLIPDHTPQMNCNAPWHSGMAYAMGYMKALMSQL